MRRITCPTCGVIFDVGNPANEAYRTIKCPTPQCPRRFRVWFQQPPTPAPTPEPAHDNDTIVAKGIRRGAKIYIVCGDKRYRLRKKSNIVGRKGPVEADIQLDINDDYVSRLSAIVKVMETDKGVVVTITPHPNNMNRILVGEYELKKDDEVVLSDGTELTMGMTKMTLLVKYESEE